MKNEIAIYIGFDETLSKEIVKEISLGIEEEGVPYEQIATSGQESRRIAQSMSMQSKLDIGIGIDKAGQVAIHHKQFPDGFYLFETQIGHVGTWLRAIGANSARLAKGIPFKEVKKS